MDIMQVKDLTFIHNERKRWLKRPEVFQLGPVNLSVKRGETIAIIGENRSGKSLLAKLSEHFRSYHEASITLCVTDLRYKRGMDGWLPFVPKRIDIPRSPK